MRDTSSRLCFPGLAASVFAASLLAASVLAASILTSCGGISSSANAAMGSTPSPSSAVKTTPAITWAQPSPITYPAALSKMQLDATANVAGTFVYTPPAGTLLAAGTQKLSVAFTPTNTDNYNNASATVTITVHPPAPTPASANPQFVYYGGVYNWLSGIEISNNSVAVISGSPFTVAPPNQQFSMAAAGALIFTDCLCSSSSILGWKVDAQTGALTQVSSTSTRKTALGLAVDPTGKFLYGFGGIYGFSIDQQTGELTPLAGSPFQVDSPLLESLSSNFSPDGTWISGVAFNGPGSAGSIDSVKRDPATGAILSGPGNVVTGLAGKAAGGGPFVKGDYLLGNLLPTSSNTLGVFQLSSGEVQRVSSYQGVNGAFGIAVGPTGTRVAVIDNNSNLTLLNFDATNATLTEVAQVTLSQVPAVMNFTCDGNYLAVSHDLDNGVSVYSVANNGLQEISGSPVAVPYGSKVGLFPAVAACN